MRGLVLLLSAAVALCGAAPALEPVTCSVDGLETTAVRFAIQHINQQQDHGYKFKLSEVIVVSPTQVVMAGCVVVLSVQGDVASVVSHKCGTTKDEEELRMCPDCPRLQNLTNVEGLQRIGGVIRKYNVLNATEHYFVLSDVGRMSASYIMGVGMNYVAEFAMVETHCPVGSRIAPEACTPLCPDRARHIFCRNSENPRGSRLYCETYPAVNKVDLQPGMIEPTCHQLPRFNPAVQCTEGPALKDIHPICSWPRQPLRS
uniref:Alpha-2-HS-glycoprotein-like n=1 Tax=Gadus morhua TaxID=8049 RepID=A0A8C5BAP0_GADMO